MSGSLDGRRALITGASRGIGRAIARAYAAEGARVALAYAASPAKAEDAVAGIAAAGGSGFALHLDVSDERSVRAGVAEALDRLSGLDTLVSNAGVILQRSLLETTTAEFDRLMAVNLRGVFLVGREGLRAMVAQGTGGRVINVASDLGFFGREEFSAYAPRRAGF